MSQNPRTRRRRGWLPGVITAGALVAVAACSAAKENLLTAVDPDLIDPMSVQSAEGANAIRIGALSRFRDATAGSDGQWLFGGLLADEWSTSSTFVQNDEADERQLSANNSTIVGTYRNYARVRTAANQAIGLLNKYSPSPASNIAEMYFIRAFVEMQMAQDFCNGIVLSDGAQDPPVPGLPVTDSVVFARAIASYDSALALSTATDAFTVSIRNAATVGKARALMGINQQAQAATLVAAIPTTFTYDLTFSTVSGDNILWNQPSSSQRYTVSDSLEGNGRNLLVTGQVPFFSAKDPRLPVSYTIASNGKDTVKSQDGLTFSRRTTLWARTSNVPVVNGIDARMIEAEAKAKAGDIAGAMAVLNAIRTAPPAKLGEVALTATSLPALTAPATTAATVDLVFRERAFWTFSRGQRLGDLRRLMRQYGRSEAQTFPTGNHYRGGTYGHDVNFPVVTDENNNPNLVTLGTKSACLDRNP